MSEKEVDDMMAKAWACSINSYPANTKKKVGSRTSGREGATFGTAPASGTRTAPSGTDDPSPLEWSATKNSRGDVVYVPKINIPVPAKDTLLAQKLREDSCSGEPVRVSGSVRAGAYRLVGDTEVYICCGIKNSIKNVICVECKRANPFKAKEPEDGLQRRSSS
jgi:hypothetical protein